MLHELLPHGEVALRLGRPDHRADDRDLEAGHLLGGHLGAVLLHAPAQVLAQVGQHGAVRVGLERAGRAARLERRRERDRALHRLRVGRAELGQEALHADEVGVQLVVRRFGGGGAEEDVDVVGAADGGGGLDGEEVGARSRGAAVERGVGGIEGGDAAGNEGSGAGAVEVVDAGAERGGARVVRKLGVPVAEAGGLAGRVGAPECAGGIAVEGGQGRVGVLDGTGPDGVR